MKLLVNSTGPGLTFQDEGRPGWARFGVAPCGALDPDCLHAANFLLHNPPGATALEIAGGGASLEVLEPGWLAYCGGPLCPELGHGTARFFATGARLDFQPSPRGLWGYLATPSGWNAPAKFGSASRHARSGLGQTIDRKDQLTAAAAPGNPFPAIALRRLAELPPLQTTEALRLHPGPDHFSQKAIRELVSTPWEISTAIDRTGYRLEGPPLGSPGSRPSSPVLPGSLQITTGGNIIVTLNDGPTVGGYPVIGLIDPSDLPLFVQKIPGSTFRFAWKQTPTS